MEIIITTLIGAAVFQGFLLGIVFIFSKKHKSFSNKLLGLFLITFIFGAISDLLPFGLIGSYKLTSVFSTPEVQLLLPVLFLHYVLEKIGRSSYYRKFLRIHYSLAFAIIAITVISIIINLINEKSVHDYLSAEALTFIHSSQRNYAFMLTVAVFIISIVETLKYRRIAQNEYSDSTMLEISWLWQFIFILAPVIVLWGAELIRIYLGGIGLSEFVVLIWASVAVFIYFVSFKAFTHQNLFHEAVLNTKAENKTEVQLEIKEEKSNHTVCEEIKQAMETERFFLRFDLSIHDFAKEINKSPRLISTCINQNFGFNFNEWVNNYRVEFALEILKDKNNNHLSIEGVGSDSGFKSRSAMYIAFKKKTGETPGYYRSN